MEIKKNTLLQRVKAYYRLFDSNGETLAIIEPGYIVNKYAYMVWRLLDEEKTLNELLQELCIYVEGADEKDLVKKISQGMGILENKIKFVLSDRTYIEYL